MRFVEDQELSFCMTVSSGIDRDVMLDILGKVDKLPIPQIFDDFAWDINKTAGKTGLLNVFEEGDLLITLENRGYLGARHKTLLKVAAAMAGKIGHYVCILRSFGDDGYYYYAEIQDGMVLASFDPENDEIPEVVEEFFPVGGDVRAGMIKALEYRMEVTVKPEWMEQSTDTYIIEYRFRRD